MFNFKKESKLQKFSAQAEQAAPIVSLIGLTVSAGLAIYKTVKEIGGNKGTSSKGDQ